jgi:hypothetical protein
LGLPEGLVVTVAGHLHSNRKDFQLMKKRAKIVLALSLGGAVAAGIAGPAAYAAADGHPTTATSAALVADTASPSAGSSTSSHHRPAYPGRFGPQFAQDLAAQLGVSADKVTGALKQIRVENATNHKATGNGGQKSGGPGQRAQRIDQFSSELAGKLGLDTTKVKNAVTTVLAKEKADRQAALKARLDQAVKSGKISQSDADAYLRVVNSGALAGTSK